MNRPSTPPSSHLLFPKRIARRDFLRRSALAAGACVAGNGLAQTAGDRPKNLDVGVLNPRGRVPVSIIIDDSTVLVNLNRFAMPQFDAVHRGANPVYQRNWREWPAEIPDSFVRKFAEWSAENGVKGKYSVVPFPACVGRLDRMLPGWSQQELNDSIKLVREAMLPNWDIHPEMLTHTRIIDTKTGHPFPEISPKFMENWEWTTGRSADEIAEYMAYALRILKNVGLPCEGITTPGGFGKKARPQMIDAVYQSVHEVFGTEIPNYFTDLWTEPGKSVAPVVQGVAALDGANPRCTVAIPGCTGDWTGGWDCITPAGADKFITADGQRGRMVDVIASGEPALMFGHWTGIYFNGYELGFKIFDEVVQRLRKRFDNLVWMKLSEIARYWAAKELTHMERTADGIAFRAPFACGDFTVRWKGAPSQAPMLAAGDARTELKQVNAPLKLVAGTWFADGEHSIACFSLPKGASKLQTAS